MELKKDNKKSSFQELQEHGATGVKRKLKAAEKIKLPKYVTPESSLDDLLFSRKTARGT